MQEDANPEFSKARAPLSSQGKEDKDKSLTVNRLLVIEKIFSSLPMFMSPPLRRVF